MSEKVAYLLLEAMVVFAVVVGVHALRRRTTLVYSYAVLAFMRVASWMATRDAMVHIGPLELTVGSNIFFSATLLGVFLLYVADGRFAGRAAVVVVVGSGLLYTLASVMMHAQFPALPASMFPASSLRASTASILASLVDLVLLGLIWESAQRHFARTPLLLRVFVTLAAVFVVDGLIYVPLAHSAGHPFIPELVGIVLSRAVVAAILAPAVAAHLAREVRRYGLRLDPRPMLSIVLPEDIERELVAARHQLRVGTEALWESEERYRRMVEDIPLMVFRFTSDGRLTYANAALCQYYDRDVREILGLPVLTPIEAGERDALWERVMALRREAPTAELIAHATPSRGPLRGQRRTQSWVIRGIFSPAGERLAFQAIGKDITREVELEAKVVESERMHAIGQLAGAVAHDFNNLIFVIWACAESARLQLAKSGPADQLRAAADLLDIRKAADRASLLTRQLVAVGRAQPLQLASVDLSQLVSELRPLLSRLVPANVTLDVRCASGLPRITVDPAQIERVIINLVSNARDAMPAGGPLAVTTAVQLLQREEAALPTGRYVVLTVTDAGVGMDAATARRIFEPYFTTKIDGKGTGLGLSTAYGIVGQAGGHIRVQSTPGAGTTFHVYFPASEGAALPAQDPAAPSRAGNGGPILYCEEDERVRAQVVELLENAGYGVLCVRDPAEAVTAAASATPPSLLLVDLVAGDVTGPELASSLRRRHPALPAVFFSGSSDVSPPDPGARFWYVNKRHGLRGLAGVVSEAIASR